MRRGFGRIRLERLPVEVEMGPVPFLEADAVLLGEFGGGNGVVGGDMPCCVDYCADYCADDGGDDAGGGIV